MADDPLARSAGLEYFRPPLPFPPLYPRPHRSDVASAMMTAPANDMYVGNDHSWQDVYASYGCSVEFDVSDDDG